jgi:hypothetical protein
VKPYLHSPNVPSGRGARLKHRNSNFNNDDDDDDDDDDDNNNNNNGFTSTIL